jgi:hypothetical protein
MHGILAEVTATQRRLWGGDAPQEQSMAGT